MNREKLTTKLYKLRSIIEMEAPTTFSTYPDADIILPKQGPYSGTEFTNALQSTLASVDSLKAVATQKLGNESPKLLHILDQLKRVRTILLSLSDYENFR